ncbi:MAG: hypothetical protein NC097_05955 [Clostridium sp.]|nr:hypothetical protein [Prevotella sp.]MCM1429322.1 hypothetical protein [Clostridium sp.]MCM1475644.1 hypothetical protein [Muribaculaceae bacterium]
MVDKEGKPTEAWTAAQTLNNYLKIYSKIFKGCQVQSVRSAESLLDTNKQKMVIPFEPLTAISGNISVSQIANGDSRYLMIVNRSALSQTKFSLTFSPLYDIFQETADLQNNSIEESVVDIGVVLSFNLAAGDCMIFKYYQNYRKVTP